jgi:ParB family chromosome partitioning protein
VDPNQGPVQSQSGRVGGRRGGLGRGLGALIPSTEEPAVSGATVEVPLDAIAPNPYQPRIAIDPNRLEQLAASIRTHGVIQPLVVTQAERPDAFLLIAGERRWRAARLAGLQTVPVVVKEAAPQAQLELALVENVVRADLSPLEEAAAYRQLIEDFGMTQAQVAERVSRSRVSVTNTLRLLGAPDEVQTALQAGDISEGHARALLGLPSAIDQVSMLRDIVERGRNVRQTEDAVRRWMSRESERGAARESARSFDDGLQERLQRSLATKVSVRRDGHGTGSLTIHFFSDEQLTALIHKLADDDDF